MGTQCVGYNVWEAVKEFTSRTVLGRVVVEPPKTKGKSGEIKLTKRPDLWFFCKCGRAFSRGELLKEHQKTHPEDFKPDWRRIEQRIAHHCDQCAKTFISVVEFENHKKIHSGENPFVCAICGLGFRLNSTLKAHERSSHVPNGPYKCNRCVCSFGGSIGLRRHQSCFHDIESTSQLQTEPSDLVEVSSGDTEEKVSLEPEVEPAQPMPKLKRRKKVPEKKQQCLKCMRLPGNSRTLRKHSRVAHAPEGEKSAACSCTFAPPQTQKSHWKNYRTKNGRLNTPAALVMEGFQRIERLQKSQDLTANVSVINMSVSKSKRKSPVCRNCRKTFATESSLKSHMRRCTQERSFPCKHCGEAFKLQANMIRHVRFCHVPNGPFKCHLCTHSYTTELGLTRHSAQVHGMNKLRDPADAVVENPECAMKLQNDTEDDRSRKLWCVACEEMFDSRSSFKKHMLSSHVTNGGFPCKKCTCVFANCNALIAHVSIRHPTDKKNFQLQNNAGKNPRRSSNCATSNTLNAALVVKRKPKINRLELVKFNFMKRSQRIAPPLLRDFSQQPAETMRRLAMKVKDVKAISPALESEPQPLVPAARTRAAVDNEQKLTLVGETAPVLEMNFPNYVEDYLCDLCDASFHNPVDLIRHKKKKHVPRGEFKCNYCSCSFVSGANLKTHETKFHPDTRNANNIRRPETPCKSENFNETVTSEKQSVISNFSTDSNLPLMTNDTSTEISSKVTANMAITPVQAGVSGKKVFLCSSCNVEFESNASCMKHIETSHVEGGDFPCALCTCIFPRYHGLVAHVGVHHPREKTQGGKCGYCGQMFFSQSDLLSHMKACRPTTTAVSPKK